MDGGTTVPPGLGDLKSFGTGSNIRLDRSSKPSDAAAKGVEKNNPPTKTRIAAVPIKHVICFIKRSLNVV